jgi:uncharacterized protein (UPF0276 family)
MTLIEREFIERAARIPHHGLGLSVDVYQPDLFELADALNRRGSPCGYLEIFKAAPAALESVRRRLPDALLSYHAEGLWVTQPNPEKLSPFHAELDATAEQLRILGSHWLNHECAAKQMAGYTFGTYLPALFNAASADVTANNIAQAQQRLDRAFPANDGHDGMGPLFLLETPPLTYVGFGDMSMAEFFRLVTELTPCGVVLDIGHLWTVYRYTGEWRRRPLTAFLAEFLDAFPLERVVEIHMAGLASHPSVPFHTQAQAQAAGEPPYWIDAHGAPIPDVLSDMLAQVLEHRGLVNLKGVALEVDTKPIPTIVEEFAEAYARFGPTGGTRTTCATRVSRFPLVAHAPRWPRSGSRSNTPSTRRSSRGGRQPVCRSSVGMPRGCRCISSTTCRTRFWSGAERCARCSRKPAGTWIAPGSRRMRSSGSGSASRVKPAKPMISFS